MDVVEVLKAKTHGMPDEVVITLTTQQGRVLLDQLEAERQRADRYHFVAMSALEAQAEISEQLGISEDECDGLPEQIHEKIEMLQTELAALKGDQVPVANPVLSYADSYRAMARQGSDSVPIWGVITDLERNIAPLFTAPQNPVVLLPKFTDRHTCMNAGCDAAAAYKEDVIAMNKAAGGIVKDGE